MNRILYTLTTIVFFASALMSQDIFSDKNLQRINPASLSEAQIQRIRTQVLASGMSESDLRTYLIGKGITPEDASEMLRRIGNLPSSSYVPDFNREITNSTENPKIPKPVLSKTDSLIFGATMFLNSQLNFAPPQQFATPVNYILGPGDQVNLSITGNQELLTDIRVEPSGNLRLPYAGNVMVGGLTIEQAERKIREALSKRGFESLALGGSRLTLTIKSYRTIPITIIGARQPGNYYVSSIATAFHVIHLAGGPGDGNTYRDIEVIRKGQVVRKIDLYDFLVKGDMTSDIVLEENDLINIPTYETLVRISGAVKRPGIFMLKPNETLLDLLRFAGGFTPEAYRKNISLEQIGTNGIYSRTVSEEDYARFKPENGDLFFVGSVLSTRYDRVFITGAIKRPGPYGWYEGMKLSELINTAGGPLESMLESRGVIYRSGKDHTNAYLRFVPSEIINGRADIFLMDGDSVVLSDKKNLFPYGYVEVTGDVNNPGRYTLGEGMTALDAILLAGGMKPSAITRTIEVMQKKPGSYKSEISTLITAPSDAMLSISADEVPLKHRDVVIVKPDPSDREQKLVFLRGEVERPGAYVLIERDEKLSSVLRRAGGLTSFADENAVYIIRKSVNPLLRKDYTNLFSNTSSSALSDSLNPQKTNLSTQLHNVNSDKVQQRALDQIKHSESIFSGNNKFGDRATINQGQETITIALNNVSQIIMKPGSRNDLQLQQGDEIVVPERDNSVSVRGMVNNQITVNYSGKRVRGYLSEAGGVLHNGAKANLFVLQPNGKASMTRSFLGIRNYPNVTPGSIIIVPEKPRNERKIDPASAAALASILTSVSSLMYLIVTLSR